MNYARIALASLGAMVAYFVYGFVMFAALPAMKTEFMKYPNVYRPKDDMMKMMPYGMLAILIGIVVVAILYAKTYPAGGGIVSGVFLGVLIGIFAVCTFVIHNYVNLNIGPHAHPLSKHRLLPSVGHRRWSHRPHLQTILTPGRYC
jgi:hypothetical protein